MHEDNKTIIMEFLLVGFQSLHNLTILFFICLFIMYITILFGNFFIALIVLAFPHLHTPMYFFLSQLASAEIVFTTTIIPKLLSVILLKGDTISTVGCVTQFYMFSVSTNAESLFLTVMSYDRYLAICDPLHYSSIMNFNFCLWLTIFSWFYSFLSTFVVVVQIGILQFCGSNVIDHYYCDLTPLLEHSCSDTSLIEMEIFLFSIPIAIFPFVFIVLTYLRIVLAILRIPSTTGKKKAFSTCSSHLAVVCTYYSTLITIYVMPTKENTVNLNKFLSLLYTVLTPLFNPIIYSLRNKEIRAILEKNIFRKVFLK
ncbi:olfactory receptor-like protein OLF1 [Bombina bombina]|uniref:olfactory receptor-like protein OLF1 n=1 Tax=Bombina bombina TaxID=8345 RepID=UPI00235ABE80|nr:olfactory receptor-like protein OLF1 [Bombina bombina]